MRAVRVFRDETNLAANPALFDVIVGALDTSKYLLLLASPLAAQSRWVAAELRHWLTHRGMDNLIIVLTDGNLRWDVAHGRFDREKTTALPSEVLTQFTKEPFYVDLRWVKDPSTELTLHNSHFGDAVATISATLREVPKDQIIGEDVRLRRVTKMIAAAAVASLAALAVGLAFATNAAVEQRNIGVDRQKEAERTARVAVARQLAADAQSMLATFPQRSLLLASAAVKTADAGEGVEPLAKVALGEALARIQGRPLLSGDSRAGEAMVSDNAQTLVLAGRTSGYLTWRLTEIAPKPTEFQSTGRLELLALSSSGRWLVFKDQAGRARLKQLDGIQADETDLASAGAKITSALFNPVGNWVLITGKARAVDEKAFWRNGRMGLREIAALAEAEGPTTGRFWDLRGSQPRAVEAPREIIDADASVFSPDGAWLATGDDSGTVRIWSMRGDAPTLTGTLSQNLGSRGRFLFSPDSRWFFTSGGLRRDGPNRVSRVREHALVYLPAEGSSLSGFTLPLERLAGREDKRVAVPRVTAAAFGTGDQLAVGTIDGTISIWRLVNGAAPESPAQEFTHEAPAKTIRFSPNGKWLLVKPDSDTDGERSVLVDDLRPQLFDLSAAPGGKPFVLRGTDAKDFRFSDDSAWLFVQESFLDIWSLQPHSTGVSQVLLVRSEPGVSTLKALPEQDSTALLTGHADGSIRINRLVPGKIPGEAVTLLWHESPIKDIAPALSRNWLASIADDGSAAQWRFLPDWKPLVSDSGIREIIERPGKTITGVHFDAAGKNAAIRLREGPALLGAAAMPGGPLSDDGYPEVGRGYFSDDSPAALSPDGRWLAIGGDHKLVVTRVNGAKVQCPSEHTLLIRSVGGSDPALDQPELIEKVMRITFSADSQWLLVNLFPTYFGCPQHNAILWRMPSHRFGPKKFNQTGLNYMFASTGRWLIEQTRDAVFLMDMDSPDLDRHRLEGSLVDKRPLPTWNGRWLILEKANGDHYAVDLMSPRPADTEMGLDELPDNIRGLAISPDNKWLWAVGFRDSRIIRMDEPLRESSGVFLRTEPDHLFLNGGRKLAITGLSGSILIDLSQSSPDKDQTLLARGRAELSKSPDDCWLAWISQERTIAALNTCIADGKTIILRPGGAGAENGDLAFDTNSRLLAFVGSGGAVLVWELDGASIGRPIFTDRVEGSLEMIGFIPGAEPVLLAKQAGRLVRWSFATNAGIDSVRKIVPRPLSREECDSYFPVSDAIIKRSGNDDCRAIRSKAQDGGQQVVR